MRVRVWSCQVGVWPCDSPRHFLQLVDQAVNVFEEGFPAGVRAAGEQVGGMFGELPGARIARPASDLAVGHQSQSTQVVATPGMAKVGKQVLKARLQAQVGKHVAMQHEMLA